MNKCTNDLMVCIGFSIHIHCFDDGITSLGCEIHPLGGTISYKGIYYITSNVMGLFLVKHQFVSNSDHSRIESKVHMGLFWMTMRLFNLFHQLVDDLLCERSAPVGLFLAVFTCFPEFQ